jgi:hypothetical protein
MSGMVLQTSVEFGCCADIGAPVKLATVVARCDGFPLTRFRLAEEWTAGRVAIH